jgi:putative PIN family toxin of toxin-antitoxin system
MPGQIVDAALEGRFISITSDALLDELRRVLRYEQLRAKFPEPDEIVALWAETCVVVSPAMTFELAAGDNHVLEAAAEGSVDYIVTGDKPLLALADDNSRCDGAGLSRSADSAELTVVALIGRSATPGASLRYRIPVSKRKWSRERMRAGSPRRGGQDDGNGLHRAMVSRVCEVD